MKLTRLTELRKQKKWTMQETADQLGIAKSTYAGYESGYRQPSLDSLIKLADIMNTSIDYLLNRTDDPRSPDDQKMVLLDDSNQPLDWEIRIDGAAATEDELHDFLAFVRTKRQLRQ
ncbi:UNVERIFIED_CONTAM: helix-turn-helix transcriptional regulator [Halobacillus marinus]|uniref:helix-turn-helix domain-containing protein n=1 Tax=Halobacillus sp. BAB-2008 TaxID=1246484 RepID=UPI0002A4DB33|nr:helix-turn-helix transcriptional regulator [Halobacillus sp. BAB-2008]ELK47749.1 HTH-type transcriptional regulator ansR [Halobacillus sp. BAB-2008]